MKLSSTDIRAMIPTWLTDEKIFELKEAFHSHDKFKLTHDFDFVEHLRNPRNWKCMSLEESDSENFRIYNLKPLHLFGEVFFVEVVTTITDDEIISHLVGCE